MRGRFLSAATTDVLCRELDELSDDFPEEFFKLKILPELLKSVQFGGGGPKVLNTILRIGSKLSDDEFELTLVPVIVRLFASPDRAMRVSLLDNLPVMIDRIPQKDVSNKIFPTMVTGFTDTAPVVREQTVKAVLTIIGKLSDRIINGELLRHLARTASDEQPGIRTNTTICLGKIARNLGASTRSKVLIAAFSRSMRDPFVHARNAALLALAATADVFSDEDCATKILPAICLSIVDKEKYNEAYLFDFCSLTRTGLFEIKRTRPLTCTCNEFGNMPLQCPIQYYHCQRTVPAQMHLQLAWEMSVIPLGLDGPSRLSPTR